MPCRSSEPLDFHYNCDGKQLKGFKQRSDRIWFKFKPISLLLAMWRMDSTGQE